MALLKVIVLCRKIMKYLKIKYRLLVYFTSLTVDIKKSSENEKKSSENDQLVIFHFRSFFLFFPSPNAKSEKNIPLIN